MDHSVTCSHTQKKVSYYFQVPFSKRKHGKLIEELGEKSTKAADAKAAKTFFCQEYEGDLHIFSLKRREYKLPLAATTAART